MRKPRAKKRQYTIYYKDGTFLTYELTETDYLTISEAIIHRGIALTSIGLIATDDIRSVILQKEPEVPKDGPQPQLLEGLPALDQEAEEYLRSLAREEHS